MESPEQLFHMLEMGKETLIHFKLLQWIETSFQVEKLLHLECVGLPSSLMVAGAALGYFQAKEGD